MGDRESLYYDTISLASDAANRKSLSQSRLTIYHSAVDLAGGPNNDTNQVSNGTPIKTQNNNRLSAGNYYSQLPYGANYNNKISSNNRKSSLKQSALQYHQQQLQLNQIMLDYAGENGGYAVKERLRQLFRDGHRTVDYVLAYKDNIHHDEKRKIFEENLVKEGLQLEREETQNIHFVKIHAPTEVLSRFSEILKIKLPLKYHKEQDLVIQPQYKLFANLRSYMNFSSIALDEEKFRPRPYALQLEFSRDKKDLFDCEQLHISSNRIAVVHFILERQKFSNDGQDNIHTNSGIEKLLSDGVYQSAYPLHDGHFFKSTNERNLLLTEWGNMKNWLRHQPLDNIKDYFGPKIALYFAWLGFYTMMLIPASIFGIIGLIYGLSTMSSDKISTAICNENNTIIMCPQCDKKCDFWNLKETCTSSKFNYLIDNNYTVVYACFMSLWVVIYLELWKRYSAKIIHRWGLHDFTYEVEHARPHYLARLKDLKKKRINSSNNVLEPHAPYWRMKFPSFLLSYSVVLLFICLSVAAFFSLIVYRMAQRASRSLIKEESMSSKILLLPLTAGIFDLIVITFLDYIYTNYLAVFLTNIEYRRTETEYQESLTIKNYLFQFINYYSSLFYIAILKGKFVGYPAKYNRIFGFRQEECNPGGCLMELCIQLAIIMIGKQIVNEVLELLVPYLTKTFSRIKNKIGLTDVSGSDEKLAASNQWTEDYHLLPWSNNSLFLEYLEMVLQFGFITIFGVAFPLAPLFALLNNALELRMDAVKLLKFYKRPIPQRANDIGVWYSIMVVVSKISIASTGFIIAFSSNLIPKLVYLADKYINDLNLDGYLNFTLATFDTKDFQEPITQSTYENVTTCRYTEFRNPPGDDHPYKRPVIYWKILVARLLFLVVFQNVIGIIQTVVAWAIPDTPEKLNDQIKRERLLIHEMILEDEKKKILEKQKMNATELSSENNEAEEVNQQNDQNFTAYDIEPSEVRRRGFGDAGEVVYEYPLQDRTSSV